MLSKGSMAVGEQLDNLQMGKRHYTVFSLLAGSGFFDGFDLYLAGSVLAAMIATKFSTLANNASFISMTFLGLLIGALGAAVLGDRLGRTFTSKYSLLIYGLATVVCAIVPSFQLLVLFRFIAGLGLGAVIVTSYGLWVEVVPKRTRGFWASAMSFVINLSQPISALLALALIPHYGWRVLFWVSGIGALIVWFFQMRLLPESPRWLASKGRIKEAEKVLAQFQSTAQGVQPIQVANLEVQSGMQEKVSLWAPGVARMTILAIVMSILSLVTWYTFTSWIPTFFIKEGMSEVKTFSFAFVIMLGAIPGNALAAWLSDRFGRKSTLVVLCVVLAILGVVYGYSSSPTMIMATGFLFVTGGNILIAITIASYIPEMFPTPIRMAGSSLANAFGRGATIISPFMIVYLYTTFGAHSVFWMSSVLYLIMGACILLLGHETKKKSLEEIAWEELGHPVVSATRSV